MIENASDISQGATLWDPWKKSVSYINRSINFPKSQCSWIKL